MEEKEGRERGAGLVSNGDKNCFHVAGNKKSFPQLVPGQATKIKNQKKMGKQGKSEVEGG